MRMTTEPSLYELFQLCVLEAPYTPDEYIVLAPRDPGDVTAYRESLTADEAHLVDWDTPDAVARVSWFPDPEDSSRCVTIYVDTTDRGVGIHTDFDPRSHHVVGLAGTVKLNHANFSETNLAVVERHPCYDEDEVVAMVLGFIASAYGSVAYAAAVR